MKPRLAAQPKRFYKNTGVICSGDGKFEITLDNRKLKTIQGTPFIIESEPMAIAIAAEWDAQKDRIEQSTMHLVSNPANYHDTVLITKHILNF